MSSNTHDNCDQLQRLFDYGNVWGHNRNREPMTIQTIDELDNVISIFLRFPLSGDQRNTESLKMDYCFQCGKELLNNPE
jgi:hypothetical protein